MLLHNPVADLSSYQFLIFYATVCALVLIVAGWLVRSSDTTAATGVEPLPRDLQGYEIAFLRGDVNELVRFVVFDLMRAGALELVPGERKKPPLIRRTGAVVGEQLSAPAQVVYDYFVDPHSAFELFRSSVPVDVAAAYSASRQNLEARRLFAPAETASASRSARVAGTVLIVGIAAYRLWYAATLHHRNVLFLVAIGVVSLITLFIVTAVPRLSKRGLQYLRTLRGALPLSRDRLMPTSDAFPLIVAAGGMAALAGTPYEGLGLTFRRQAAANAASSSGGCGAASDGGTSGSSCSSGGSCGGGGCGG